MNLSSLSAMALLICALTEFHAQIVIHPGGGIHFGTFTADSDPVFDLLIENRSDQKDYLLRHTFSHEYDIRITSKELLPGGQTVIRIRFNPRTAGRFSDRILLYFASLSEPVIIPVTADVRHVDPNGSLPCPDFSERAAECCIRNMFLVAVLDDETGLPVPSAKVRIEEEGYLRLALETNLNGEVSQEVRIGFFEITAEKTGYERASIRTYINRMHNRFTIRLRPDRKTGDELPALPNLTDTLAGRSQNETLPEELFSPNNIVFLLDISGSMASGDKMDLLTLSISRLTEVLRPVDKVALISYADNARVILPAHSGAEKATIMEAVGGLQARGKTSGSKGFRRSYQMLELSRMEHGNNQLIVITDGAFDPADQKAIERLVTRSSGKKIRTSMVAVRGSNFAVEKLSSLAENGNGSFLRIESRADAESALIGELRKQSRK
jgi:Mg-chelatase subunit ChlD